MKVKRPRVEVGGLVGMGERGLGGAGRRLRLHGEGDLWEIDAGGDGNIADEVLMDGRGGLGWSAGIRRKWSILN